VLQRDLDLRGRGRLGPAQQLQGVVIAVFDRDTVVGEDLLGEIDVFLRDEVVKRLLEHLR
jgi:hypothetical protein